MGQAIATLEAGGLAVRSTLRHWQAEALPRVLGALRRRERTIVAAVMGSGKTRLLAALLAYVAPRARNTTVVTAPKTRLVEQLLSALRSEVRGATIGRYDRAAKDVDADVIVAGARSAPKLARELHEAGRSCGLWIADEAHRSEAEELSEAVDALAPVAALGLTATPYRAERSEGLSHFDSVAYRYRYADALRDGVIVPPEVVPWDGGEVTGDEATASLVSRYGDGPGVVTAGSIEDAEEYAEQLEHQHSIRADAIHSGQSAEAQAERIEHLRAGRLDCLVQVDLLTEGVDLPWLRWLALRRPIASRVKFVQLVGRALRADAGKDRALLLDPLSLCETHRLEHPEALGAAVDAGGAEPPRGTVEIQPVENPAGGSGSRTVEAATAETLPVLTSYLARLRFAWDAEGALDRPCGAKCEGAGCERCEGAGWISGSEPVKSREWRREPVSDKQASLVGRLRGVLRSRRRPVEGLPDEHRAALETLAAVPETLTRGEASDLLSVLLSLAGNRRWHESMSNPAAPRLVEASEDRKGAADAA